MRRRIELLVLTGLSLVVSAAMAGETRRQLPAQSKPVENVVVPIPREIFGSLDQFANSNWRAVQRIEMGSSKPRGDQTRIALQLGIVIAEGFISVEAEDASQVKDLGRTVLTFARALGVEKAVLRRSRSIVDFATRDDWVATRNEWDRVRGDVRDGMIALQSDQLSQLVSLGGWLRGTEVLSALLLQSYSADRAELLRQAGLLDHFDKQLAVMRQARPDDRLLAKMQDGVGQVRRLTENKSDPIAKDAIRQINRLSTKLVDLINRRP